MTLLSIIVVYNLILLLLHILLFVRTLHIFVLCFLHNVLSLLLFVLIFDYLASESPFSFNFRSFCSFCSTNCTILYAFPFFSLRFVRHLLQFGRFVLHSVRFLYFSYILFPVFIHLPPRFHAFYQLYFSCTSRYNYPESW